MNNYQALNYIDKILNLQIEECNHEIAKIYSSLNYQAQFYPLNEFDPEGCDGKFGQLFDICVGCFKEIDQDPQMHYLYHKARISLNLTGDKNFTDFIIRQKGFKKENILLPIHKFTGESIGEWTWVYVNIVEGSMNFNVRTMVHISQIERV